MGRRKPATNAIDLLCAALIPFLFWGSIYFLAPIVLLIFIRFQIPICLSKCPRCRKNNRLERWTTNYRCAGCRAQLTKEKDHHWSRLA